MKIKRSFLPFKKNRSTNVTIKTCQNKALFIVALFLSTQLLCAQNSKNREVIENLYEQLQNNSTSTQDLDQLTSKIKWDTKNTGDRYTITLYAILQNEWRGVSFQNLVYLEKENNKILASGTVLGRQPTECEGVTTAFQHIWTLKDGEIINLKE